MNKRYQLICAHSAVLLALMTGVGGFLLPGWLPPPSPGLSAAEVAAIFTPDNIAMRVGVSLVAFFGPIAIGLAAAMATQLRRIEGKGHVLANFQLAASVMIGMSFMIPAFIWLAISYRPDGLPEVIRTLNDLAWFILLASSGPLVLQTLAIGICILGDTSSPRIYPRWLAYVNVWMAIILLPGVLIPFFMKGPFAWNGLFGFWLIASGFFVWLIASYVCTVQAIRRQT